MRYAVLFACLALALSIGADAQEPSPRACTKDYLAELEDDLQANKDMRRWTTDYLRPACRAIKRTEDLSGKVLEKIGGKWLWDKTVGDYVDPRLTSATCRYVRKLGEKILTPEEDELRLKSEIARCANVRQ